MDESRERPGKKSDKIDNIVGILVEYEHMTM